MKSLMDQKPFNAWKSNVGREERNSEVYSCKEGREERKRDRRMQIENRRERGRQENKTSAKKKVFWTFRKGMTGSKYKNSNRYTFFLIL